MQRKALSDLFIYPYLFYIYYFLTVTNLALPFLDQALAACRSGDVFTVTKLYRAFSFVPDAFYVISLLAARFVKF